MSDEEEQSPDSVLRPFEPAEIEPLPPVQASSVVVPNVEPEPEPFAPPEAAAPPPPAAPPETEMVDVSAEPVPDDVIRDRSEPWSPAAAGSEEVWFGLEEAVEETAPPAAPEPEPEVVDDTAAVAEAPADAEPAGLADAPPAGVLPTASQNSEEITLPRTPFLVGVGVAALAILALFALWQSAGGDDGPTATEAPVSDDEPAEVATDDDPADQGADDSGAAAAAEAEARIDGLEATVSEQDATISQLEADLAATPPPALRGDEMRRIVVAADASFVSVGSESVAVIGPFGGYAAIDPATNAVTAAGQPGIGLPSPWAATTMSWSPSRAV